MSSRDDKRDKLLLHPVRPLGQQRTAAAQLQALIAANALRRSIASLASTALHNLSDAVDAASRDLTDAPNDGEKWDVTLRDEGAAPTRILLVEDSPMIAAMLEGVLTTLGYEVVLAGDGREALRRLSSHDVSLVLTDIDMPNMDGIALCETLRSGEETRELPVVVLSTEGSASDMRRGAVAGADAYLIKTELTELGLIAAIERFAGS